MAAVPHFDMKPGERLKGLRDVPVDAGSLLGKRTAANGAEAGHPAFGARSHQVLHHAAVRLVRQGHAKRRCAPSTASASTSGAANAWAWSAKCGCGKTTVSKIIMRAVTPDGGSVTFDDGEGPIDVLAARGDELNKLRTKIQMVFQDPVSSLSPRMTVQNILSEPLEIHDRGDSDEPAGAWSRA